MRRRRRKDGEGRFTVGEKASPSLGAAIAYGMQEAGRTHGPDTLYVRELGRERALHIIERHEDGAVTVRAA
jgi:hypothetical protein